MTASSARNRPGAAGGRKGRIRRVNEEKILRAAEEIRRYVSGHAEILKALASQLQNTGLEQWQQTTILRNYVLQFHEFRELTLFDQDRRVLSSSRAGMPRVAVPADASGSVYRVRVRTPPVTS